MDLNSKSAIVTGASNGLGRALAVALIREGVLVYGLARSEDKLNAIKEQFSELFIPVVLDVTDRAQISEWFSKSIKDRKIDILINNAGVGSFGKLDEMAPQDWDAMINTNIHGLYNITAPVVAAMRGSRSGGHIVNIGSILGKTTRSEGAAYSATKYAVMGFSESLFKEVRGDHIKVTCLNPGSIETDFFHTSGIEAHQNMLDPEAIADTVIFVLKTPDNVLIDELTIRPLNPRKPE